MWSFGQNNCPPVIQMNVCERFCFILGPKYILHRAVELYWTFICWNNNCGLSYRPSSLMRAPAPCSESSRSGRHEMRTSTNAWLRTARARLPSTPSCPSSEVSRALWSHGPRGHLPTYVTPRCLWDNIWPQVTTEYLLDLHV